MIDTIQATLSRWIRRIPLLDRWLISELVGPLIFAIAAFTVVSLSVGVMFELVRKIVESGLPVLIALQVLLLRLPSFLVISFPMATLMATLLAYSRLSANSELTALRSVGVTARRMIAPALALSLVMTSLTFVFNDVIVPRANRNAEVTLRRALGKAIATEKGDDIVYSRFGRLAGADEGDRSRGLAQLFYAREFRKGTMQGVTVLDFSRVGFTQMLVADEAKWNDKEGKWEFLNGQSVTLTPEGGTITAQFDRYLYPLSAAPIRIARLPKDANDMTVAEALQAEAATLREQYEAAMGEAREEARAGRELLREEAKKEEAKRAGGGQPVAQGTSGGPRRASASSCCDTRAGAASTSSPSARPSTRRASPSP